MPVGRERKQEPLIATVVSHSNDNVTTPTLAELTTAFGAPSTHADGWVAVVDDAGAGTASDLVWATNGAYFFVAGTLAS